MVYIFELFFKQFFYVLFAKNLVYIIRIYNNYLNYVKHNYLLHFISI